MILKGAVNNKDAEITYGFAPMKYDAYTDSFFGQLTDMILAYFFLLSILMPLLTLIGKIMQDKTSRMRETMKIAGVNDSTYMTSYFFFYAILQLIVSLGCALIITPVMFKNTSFVLLFLFFFLFAVAAFPFAIIVWYDFHYNS